MIFLELLRKKEKNKAEGLLEKTTLSLKGEGLDLCTFKGLTC